MTAEKTYPQADCDRCGAPFDKTRPDRRFCSKHCSRHGSQPFKYKRVCPMCKTHFGTNAEDREFCTPECKADARKAQFLAVMEEVGEMQAWQKGGMEVGRWFTTMRVIYDLFCVDGFTNQGLVWLRYRLDTGDLSHAPADMQVYADQLLDAVTRSLEARTGYRPITRLSVEHVEQSLGA